MVSIAIMVLITTLVLVRHRNFQSDVLLKNEAYELMLVLRETQTTAMSTLKSGTHFDYPYGVVFDLNDDTHYKAFQFENSDAQIEPTYFKTNNSKHNDARDIETYQLGEGYRISKICVTRKNDQVTCNGKYLSVAFKRPESKVYLDAQGNFDVKSAEVELSSDTSHIKVTIGAFGQMSVIN